jgi:hypothetical protein
MTPDEIAKREQVMGRLAALMPDAAKRTAVVEQRREEKARLYRHKLNRRIDKELNIRRTLREWLHDLLMSLGLIGLRGWRDGPDL